MKYLLVLLLIFTLSTLKGETEFVLPDSTSQPKDSIIRKYFICESKKPLRRSRIFKDGDKLSIRDKYGRHYHGTIKIISDSSIEISRFKRGDKDTVLLKSIYLLKKMGIARAVAGYTLLYQGSSLFIGGVALVAQRDDPSGVNLVFGMLALIASVPLNVGAALLLSGKKFVNSNYTYKIVKTKGIEVKNKYY